MEGMAHHDDHRERRDALLTSDDILMSVAMSRLCMQSERVVRAVRERQKGVATGGGEIFEFDTDTEDNTNDDGDKDVGDGGGMITNADVVTGVSPAVWQEWLAVVRREMRAMQQEDERVCAWYRKPGTEEDDLAHLENVMRKLSEVWRLRDHVMGFMDEEAVVCDADGEMSAIFVEKVTFFLMCSLGAEELEEEGLRTTRVVRAKYGDDKLPALEGWLGGQRSVAWWLRESEVGAGGCD